MDATKVRTIWQVDQDTIDYGEHRYDIGYVEQHSNGSLEVMLDSVPIESRLYCYNNYGTSWIVTNIYGHAFKDIDREIMEVLIDIQNTIAKLTK